MNNSILNRLSKLSIGQIVAKTGYYIFKRPIIVLLSHFGPSVDEHKLVFESNPDFSDNGLALTEYLLESGYSGKYSIYWIVEDPKKFQNQESIHFIRKRGRFSKSRTIASYYHIFTAKYLFFTHTFNWFGKKNRKQQTYVNLWHGCGYKAVKKSNEKIEFDYCLVPGPIFVKTKTEFFECNPDQLLTLGYPRYDWMLKKDDDLKSRWLQQCKNAKYFVLWMPTFRNSELTHIQDDTLANEYGVPLFDSLSDIEEINRKCCELGILLLIKMHIYQKKTEYPVLSNIRFVTNKDLEAMHSNLYCLVGQCDALLSDYSSISVDYLLLNRPIGYVLSDYEAYTQSRGFVFDNPLEYMPGAKIYQKSELMEFLQSVTVSRDQYEDEREEKMNIMHHPTDSYCRRVVEHFGL